MKNPKWEVVNNGSDDPENEKPDIYIIDENGETVVHDIDGKDYQEVVDRANLIVKAVNSYKGA